MGTQEKAIPGGASSERLLSIDALRGFDMFWIVGGEALAVAIASWIGGTTQDVVDEQLTHAEWVGFHFYDLIFPLFLFLVGVVLPFSLGKHRERGFSWRSIYGRVLRRSLLLFFLGLTVYGFMEFHFAEQRYVGVLQRIAICYLIAA